MTTPKLTAAQRKYIKASRDLGSAARRYAAAFMRHTEGLHDSDVELARTQLDLEKAAIALADCRPAGRAAVEGR